MSTRSKAWKAATATAEPRRAGFQPASGSRTLIEFAKTLRTHVLRIVAWYEYPISTGPLEGTNNKTKTMKRQAYGFRDQEFLRLKIVGTHETKYASVG